MLVQIIRDWSPSASDKEHLAAWIGIERSY